MEAAKPVVPPSREKAEVGSDSPPFCRRVLALGSDGGGKKPPTEAMAAAMAAAAAEGELSWGSVYGGIPGVFEVVGVV